ncbi:MAG: hypothetical protein KDA91_13605 [Planctomycetaceae bacterium]|nr:hypothetical protein [Planctomycetaceae bacterium]
MQLSDELWLRLQFLKRWLTPFLCYGTFVACFPGTMLFPPFIMLSWWFLDLFLTGRTEHNRMIRPFSDVGEGQAWFMIFISNIFVSMFAVPFATENQLAHQPHSIRLAGGIVAANLLMSGVVIVKGNIYKVFLARYSSDLSHRRSLRQKRKAEMRQQRLVAREQARRVKRVETARRAEEHKNRSDQRFARMSAEFERRLNAIKRMPVPQEEKEGLVEEAETRFLDDAYGLLNKRMD